MKNILNKVLLLIILISSIAFTSCENTDDKLNTELSIEEKVEILESNEWLLKGFEDRVMYSFKDGERLTYYAVNNVFSDQAIPGTHPYKIEGEIFKIDLHFGNIITFNEIQLSCDNQIIEFYIDGELNMTLYKRNSNYKDCL